MIDQRQVVGDAATIHAFIVGVSDYPHLLRHAQSEASPHLGMQPLSSAALTGSRIYTWLSKQQDRLPLPLATVRLLLSPSPDELSEFSGALSQVEQATTDHFLKDARDWRDDADGHPESMTIFYFAGHGLQRRRDDAIVLLQDFGDGFGGLLRHSIEVKKLVSGMAPMPSRNSVARKQLYFIDACRNLPDTMKELEGTSSTDPFSFTELSGRDDRQRSVFYAALPDSQAYALRGTQTVFSKALLHCLDVAGEAFEAGDDVTWMVTTTSLNAALSVHFSQLSLAERADQDFVLECIGQDMIVCRLEQPPQVKVRLEINPDTALNVTKIHFENDRGVITQELPLPLPLHPFDLTLPAGTYGLFAKIEPATLTSRDYVKWKQVKPPLQLLWEVHVTP